MNVEPGRSPDILTVLHARIDADPAGVLNEADLAPAAHVTTSQLRATLLAQNSVTPAQFVLRHRLDAVHRALLAEDFDVADVARQWGVIDLARFTAVYTQRHGQTPAETIAGATSAEC
ncbi:helix-turn-helix transcriptional regulator [Curtobacterium flaccumfaciens]|uniref:helix-turn-helix transcriptional regulator n=1 Tax=Curtobacterium flaccumfaciens TaxID=2035 RepID=UPI001375DA56|nr:helix-turn-helix transcriptional regulator [Curtobacterium flaccumfaciens]